MDEYYRKIQDKLLIQMGIIDNLLKKQHTRIPSDYYEAIVRDIVRENVPKSFSVSRGIVLNKDGDYSEECDLILYDSAGYDTWFQSGEIVVVSPEAVRVVIEIKRTLNSRKVNEAINPLSLINGLRGGIFKFIVGFNITKQYVYSDLRELCIQSRVVNRMFAFNSGRLEDKVIIDSEMKKFLEVIKQITSTQISSGLDATNEYIEEVMEDAKIRKADQFIM
ncbi:DUF6602 domain-containing protein, partial [Chloroflexota bacterium]